MTRTSRLLPLLLVAACSEAAGGPTATVTDSAGVQIVTSTAPAWGEGEGWAIDSVPSLDIGGSDTDPHYDLLRVSGVTQLSGGRIAVLTAGTKNIQFYDSTGIWLSSRGRDGEGPGEFRSPFMLQWVPGDTLFVYDSQLRRMTRLLANGSFLPPMPANEGGGGMQVPFARLSDGSWMAFGLIVMGDEMAAGLVRPSTLVVHLDPDLRVRDTVTVLPGTEAWITMGANNSGNRVIGMSTLPLGLSSSFTAGDSLLVAGDQARYEIGVYRADGTLVRSIRRSGARQKVTDAMWEQLEQQRLANARDPDKARENWEQLPRPDALPAFGALTLDADGNLWVARPTVPKSDTVVDDVFDRDGKWLGPVTMPLGFRPWEIGPDYILGVWKDEDGLSYVRRYEIVGKTGRREDGK